MSRSAAVTMAVVLAGLTGCARSPRFADAPPVWYADDKRDIEEPKRNKFVRFAFWLDVYGMRRTTRAMELHGKTPARNTNSLDELPNSTWFTNRIGVREVSPEEAAAASSLLGPPSLPLTVTKGKIGGTRPGFFAKDSTGRSFLIKFDFRANPDMQTGTGIVANRLFWAMGYNVPAEYIVLVRNPEDIEIDAKATLEDEFGKDHTIDRNDLKAMFDTSPTQADGTYRVYASELVKGKPLGGAHTEGVRRDDPNDVVPHEHRRELRAIRVFGAWLGHTDIKEDNTLDVYTEEGGRRFVRHYMVDLNECLGSHQANMGRLEDGWEYNVDWGMQLKALFALGFWKRPWEDQKQTPWLSVGAFSADQFDPRKWRPAFPYWPLFETDKADAFWAAKIVMRFDRPILEAVVAQGQFSADASAYLVKTLLARARKIGKAYIETLTPLDLLRIKGKQLCAYDLAVYHGLATAGSVERLGKAKRVLAEATVDRYGRVCMPIPAHERYTVWRLRSRRGKATRPPMEVHFKGGRTPRVLGIRRIVKP